MLQLSLSLSRMILHLSPACHLSPSSSCLQYTLLLWPRDCTLVSHLSPLSPVLWLASPLSLLVSNTLWVLWLHAFALVSHLSLLVSNTLWVLWLQAFALVCLWVLWAA